MPAYDRIIILFHRIEISICRMCCPVHDRFWNRWDSFKVHVCHPHRDHIKSVFWRFRCKSRILSKSVYCNRIFSMPVYNLCKIISHIFLSCFPKTIFHRRLPSDRYFFENTHIAFIWSLILANTHVAFEFFMLNGSFTFTLPFS